MRAMVDLRPVEPAVRVLLHEGWEMKTLAFFHGMDDEAIRDRLPTTARAWTHEEMDGLRREAKRQQRALDIEDTAFYNHQKLLYRDSSFLEKKIGNLPETVSVTGTSMVLARKSLGSRGRPDCKRR